MRMTERIATDNVIRMSSSKDYSSFIESIVIKCQPAVYNRYGCLILRFGYNLRTEAYNLCKYFWHLGLVPQKLQKSKVGITSGRGEIIEHIWEITLTKIGQIVFDDGSDFDDWYSKVWKEGMTHGI